VAMTTVLPFHTLNSVWFMWAVFSVPSVKVKHALKCGKSARRSSFSGFAYVVSYVPFGRFALHEGHQKKGRGEALRMNRLSVSGKFGIG
jgi:hypothetical protein